MPFKESLPPTSSIPLTAEERLEWEHQRELEWERARTRAARVEAARSPAPPRTDLR